MKNWRIIILILVFMLFFTSFIVYNYPKLNLFSSGLVTSNAVAPIFTIRIIDFQSPTQLGEFLDFSYFVRSIAGVNGSAQVNFWLEKEREVITLGSDSIYLGNFEEKTRNASIFLPSNLESGVYNLKLEINYNGKIIKSFRTIEIKVSGGKVTINQGIGTSVTYIILSLIGLAFFNIILLYILERERIKKIFLSKKDFLKKYRLSFLTLTFFLIIGGIIYYLNLIDALFGIPLYIYYSLLAILLTLVLGRDILINKKDGNISPHREEENY